jgi:hypothetical protein
MMLLQLASRLDANLFADKTDSYGIVMSAILKNFRHYKKYTDAQTHAERHDFKLLCRLNSSIRVNNRSGESFSNRPVPTFVVLTAQSRIAGGRLAQAWEPDPGMPPDSGAALAAQNSIAARAAKIRNGRIMGMPAAIVSE